MTRTVDIIGNALIEEPCMRRINMKLATRIVIVLPNEACLCLNSLVLKLTLPMLHVPEGWVQVLVDDCSLFIQKIRSCSV